jgi:hypothetical protein
LIFSPGRYSLIALASLLFDCGPSPSRIRLSHGQVSVDGKSAYLGEPVEAWKKRFGPTDSATLIWEEWRRLGMVVNYRKNACDEQRVTCVTFAYRSSLDYPMPTTNLPIQLEQCKLQVADSISGDTLVCNSTERFEKLTLIKPERDSKFWHESKGLTVTLEIDSMRYPVQVGYCLSDEKAFLIGMERTPEESKAFVDSGGCGKIPSLW